MKYRVESLVIVFMSMQLFAFAEVSTGAFTYLSQDRYIRAVLEEGTNPPEETYIAASDFGTFDHLATEGVPSYSARAQQKSEFLPEEIRLSSASASTGQIVGGTVLTTTHAESYFSVDFSVSEETLVSLSGSILFLPSSPGSFGILDGNGVTMLDETDFGATLDYATEVPALFSDFFSYYGQTVTTADVLQGEVQVLLAAGSYTYYNIQTSTTSTGQFPITIGNDLKLSVVPEPSSFALALCGVGMFGLGIQGGKRKASRYAESVLVERCTRRRQSF